MPSRTDRDLVLGFAFEVCMVDGSDTTPADASEEGTSSCAEANQTLETGNAPGG